MAGYGPKTRPNPNAHLTCVRGFEGCGATPGTYVPATRLQKGRKAHSKACQRAWKASGKKAKVGYHAHRNPRKRAHARDTNKAPAAGKRKRARAAPAQPAASSNSAAPAPQK